MKFTRKGYGRLLRADGTQVSQHTVAEEAYERASTTGPGRYTYAPPNMQIDVPAAPAPIPIPDPVPVPVPDPVPDPIPVPTGRLMPADLQYLGKFTLGRTPDFEAFGGDEGNASISFRADGDAGRGSLIVQSRGQVFAEMSIPAVGGTSARVATYAHPAAGTFSGQDRFGGLAWASARDGQPARLFWSVFEYYNTDGTDYASLGWANISGTTIDAKAGVWHVGPAASNGESPFHGQKHGEYIIPVPQAWANQYTGGRSLLVGRMREAGAFGGSMGPVLTAVAPWRDGSPPATGANLSALSLMCFAQQQSHFGADMRWADWRSVGDPAYEYWSPMDWHRGGAWVERNGKRALIMGGRKAEFDNDPVQPTYGDSGSHGAVGSTTPPFCYGGGGVECRGSLAISSSKGYHCGPYSPRLWFYDVAQLAEVASGARAPNAMQSYACIDPKRAGHWTARRTENVSQYVAGPAYDSATGRLYVLDPQGDDPNGHPNPYWPIVHVYQVT